MNTITVLIGRAFRGPAYFLNTHESELEQSKNMKFRANLAFLICGVLLTVGIVVKSQSATSGPKAIFDNPTEPVLSPQLNLGKMNYDAFCASCHGKTAGGSDKGPTFISRIYHPGHHGDQAFFIAPKKGARSHHWPFGDMKPVPGVIDSQLALILDYVRAVQIANGVF
ncbi:MAG: cytochrome c [Rhodospirillales bacterium]